MNVMPDSFRDFILQYWKNDMVAQLESGLCEESPVSIRLNPARGLVGEASVNLAEADDDTLAQLLLDFDSRVPWCPEGLYLKARPVFTADPLLHAGTYYVQEASSMFIGHALRYLFQCGCIADGDGLCIDMCAAPGGKSTLLRSLLPANFRLIANEPVRNRAQVLAENLAKWGAHNTLVTNLMPAQLVERLCCDRLLPADLLVCDVPCSGEGMFRKEAEAINQWTPALVESCARLQREIVRTAWDVLRPGGILAYSTCTFNPFEDEANVQWICQELGGETIEIPLAPQWGIRRYSELARTDAPQAKITNDEVADRCYHFLPGCVRGEGFFCSFIRKSPDAEMTDFILSGKKGKGTDRHSPTPDRQGKRGNKAIHSNKGGKTNSYKTSKSSYGTKSETTDSAFLPTDLLDAEGAPRLELSLTDALRYLQRESLTLPASTPSGIVTVCYCGQRLGLMNNLGSRANNLYPKEWRVRSGHLTAQSIVRNLPSETP